MFLNFSYTKFKKYQSISRDIVFSAIILFLLCSNLLFLEFGVIKSQTVIIFCVFLVFFQLIYTNTIVFLSSYGFNLFFCFSCSLVFFIYSSFIFDLINGVEFFSGVNNFKKIYINESSKIKSLAYFNFFHVLLFFSYQSSKYFYRQKIRTNNTDCAKDYFIPFSYRALILIYVSSLPIIVYKLFLKYSFVTSYQNYVDGIQNLDKLNTPFYTFGIGLIALISFSMIIGFKPKLSLLVFVLFSFFCIKYFESLLGTRRSLIIYLVSIFWFTFRYYRNLLNIKSKLIILVLTSVIFLFSSIFINNYRFSFDFKDTLINIFDTKKSNSNIADLVVNFLHSQSDITSSILPIYFELKDNEEFNSQSSKTPYIFTPLHFILKSDPGQSQNKIDDYNSFSDKLSFYINPQNYLKGHGFGSSFFVDLIDLGIFGFIIISIFIGILFFIFDNIDNYFVRSVSIVTVGQILYMPRVELFNDARNIFFVVLSSTLFCIILYSYQKIKNFK